MKSQIFATGASSRRSFLSRALAGGAAATVLGVTPWSMRRAFALPGTQNDIDILNYALTLEHLEYAFYRDQLARFNRNAFRGYNLVGSLSRNLHRVANRRSPITRTHPDTGETPPVTTPAPAGLYDLLLEVRNHEGMHVQTLTDTITSLGGTPVPELTYNFGVDNVREFLRVAQTLENTGVTAYDGAIARIDSPDLRTAGATIATVEARHASFLNLVNGDDPFPSAFDVPKTMDEIVAAITPFIVP